MMHVVSNPLPVKNTQGPWPNGKLPSMVVCHFSQGYTAKVCYDTLLARGLSVHYTIERDGTCYEHVPSSSRAIHAGGGRWAGNAYLNNIAFGFEAVNFGWGEGELNGADSPHPIFDYGRRTPSDPEIAPDPEGHQWYRDEISNGKTYRLVTRQAMAAFPDHRKPYADKLWPTFPDKQIEAVCDVIWSWVRQYGILLENIVGHEHVAPERKVDPGPAWPWRRIAEALESRAARELPLLLEPDFRKEDRVKALQSHLSRMGFQVGDIDGVWGPKTKGCTEAALETYSGTYRFGAIPAAPTSVLPLCNAFRLVPGFDPGNKED